jgi:hypothetical protein
MASEIAHVFAQRLGEARGGYDGFVHTRGKRLEARFPAVPMTVKSSRSGVPTLP